MAGEHLSRLVVAPSADGGSVSVSFLVSTQQSLLERFEDVCSDEALKVVHAQGYMPVGQPFVSVEPAGRGEIAVSEGRRLTGSIDDLALDSAILRGDVLKVTVDFIVGLAL